MAKKQKAWMYSPPKQPKPKIPETLKAEVTTRANELIDTVLKPKYIQPPPENPRFNYIVDIYGKWYHSAFYFCTTYCCPGPNAISPSFESKFARMQYAGKDRFHLSFMRHNGEWVELYTDQTVDECLTAVKDDPWFTVG
jgi:hypothetical protein